MTPPTFYHVSPSAPLSEWTRAAAGHTGRLSFTLPPPRGEEPDANAPLFLVFDGSCVGGVLPGKGGFCGGVIGPIGREFCEVVTADAADERTSR